jgi:hypothetical protein
MGQESAYCECVINRKLCAIQDPLLYNDRFGDDPMQTIARIRLALTVLGYALGTINADFNKMHSTNRKCTPHARLHVILSYAGLGFALYLICLDGSRPLERLYLARRRDLWRILCGGRRPPDLRRRSLRRQWISPLHASARPANWRWDANVTGFTILSTITVMGILAVLAS